MVMRKVLVSPGFGNGWSTCNSHGKFMAEYQPIIDALERGEELNASHPAVLVLLVDMAEKGCNYVCLGGLDTLRVETAEEPYHIKDHDGHETVKSGEDWDWEH